MKTIVRAYLDSDLKYVAEIHNDVFPRQGFSDQWIACNALAYPRTRYYVSVSDGVISGYILWVEKSGFRAQVVLELEQIAVARPFRNQGIGSSLIRLSLSHVNTDITHRGAKINSVLVTTRVDNKAQLLYQEVLGAEVVATVPSLYSVDELFMVAKQPLKAIVERKHY